MTRLISQLGNKSDDVAFFAKLNQAKSSLTRLDGAQASHFRYSTIYQMKLMFAAHLQARNQSESKLLGLPTELLITIAKPVWPDQETFKYRPVVMTSRCRSRFDGMSLMLDTASYTNRGALLWTCSRLRNELFPTFLARITFVAQVPSNWPDPYDGKPGLSDAISRWLTSFLGDSWRSLFRLRVWCEKWHSV